VIETKDREKEPEKKEYDFDYCPKHNMKFPKGAECPKCKEEKKEMIDSGSI
jgi:hypothetical protein